jgi:hypothetical protein
MLVIFVKSAKNLSLGIRPTQIVKKGSKAIQAGSIPLYFVAGAALVTLGKAFGIVAGTVHDDWDRAYILWRKGSSEASV